MESTILLAEVILREDRVKEEGFVVEAKEEWDSQQMMIELTLLGIGKFKRHACMATAAKYIYFNNSQPSPTLATSSTYSIPNPQILNSLSIIINPFTFPYVLSCWSIKLNLSSRIKDLRKI